jgi:threonine/homoserine efflux transporter RhtA
MIFFLLRHVTPCHVMPSDTSMAVASIIIFATIYFNSVYPVTSHTLLLTTFLHLSLLRTSIPYPSHTLLIMSVPCNHFSSSLSLSSICSALLQVVEKGLTLQERDKMCADLKNILSRQPGPEVSTDSSAYVL